MNKVKIIVSRYYDNILVAIYDGVRFIQFYLFDGNKLPIGTIMLSRVENHVKSLNACYVSMPDNNKGYLQRADIKQGELIPVMLVKDGTATKAPIVSTDVEISGIYCVVFAESGGISFSKKIESDIVDKLSKELCDIDIQFKTIIRTNAANASINEIIDEINYIHSLIKNINSYGNMRTKDTVLYIPNRPYINCIQDINVDEISEIICDDYGLYNEINDEYYSKLNCIKQNDIKLIFHDSSRPSFNVLYSLSTRLEDTLNKIVWLKSGGYLVIEQTEALVSIDVNSGGCKEKDNTERTYYKTNCEAAIEVAYQIRLRNLSGIIIVDFINMKSENDINDLYKLLDDELKKDSGKAKLHDFTKLGLAEITRTKTSVSIPEQLRVINRKKDK